MSLFFFTFKYFSIFSSLIISFSGVAYSSKGMGLCSYFLVSKLYSRKMRESNAESYFLAIGGSSVTAT